MSSPSWFSHIRDILLLPFTVAVIVPALLYRLEQPGGAHGLWQTLIGFVVIAAGLALFLITFNLFRRFGGGTLAPWQPTQKLIVRGPYRYCRNPMITGVLIILAGQAVLWSSLYILAWALVFCTVNTLYFIVREEPDLEKRFGSDYRHYKARVPRWIPRLTPYVPESEHRGKD